jgi:hypothetical protein
LTSALYGTEWSASRYGRFIPREIAPGTPWIGGWVGLRAGLDAVVKRKIPLKLISFVTYYKFWITSFFINPVPNG